MSLIAKFLNDDSGATAIEYGLIAAGISVAIIAVVQGLGTKLNSTFALLTERKGGPPQFGGPFHLAANTGTSIQKFKRGPPVRAHRQHLAHGRKCCWHDHIQRRKCRASLRPV